MLHSPVYETAPVGVRPEYEHLSYLNAALVVEADIAPDAMSEAIHAIEDNLGRVRTADRFAPRTADIDLLYADRTIYDSETLTLPPPRWAERRFVVQPLADLRPNLVLPGERRSVAEILTRLSEEPSATLFTDDW